MSAPILEALGLASIQSGTYLGNGEWATADAAGRIRSVDPSTNAVLAEVQATTRDDYETLIRRAQDAFATWRATPAPRRGEAVRLCGEALRRHKDALGSLVALEMGKIKPEGDGEVQEMIDIADFAVGQSRMLYGFTMHSERPRHRMYEQWHPLGLVGVISAFNFPVAVWAWNAMLAAICGDVTIWKPSPKTPLSAIATMRICSEALRAGGFPDVFFLFNDAGTELAEAFVDDRRIPLISFTGSTKVGRRVGERVARRLGRSLLELGGNNAIVVDASADLKLAIPAIVFGAVGTAGQRCTTTRRLFVHESLYDDVLARLVKAYRQVEARIGDPTLATTLMGPLNSKAAIAQQNAVPQGLSSAIFTRDLEAAERYLSAAGSDCGIANVNIGTSGAEIGGAFGGEKDTGGGRESGSDAWKAYMRRQTNTINYSDALPLAQGIRFDL